MTKKVNINCTFTRLFYQLIYTSLVGQLGSGRWSWVSTGLADKVWVNVS